MADSNPKTVTLVDEAFWKVFGKLPKEYAEEYLERFVDRLMDPKEGPDIPDEYKRTFNNAVVSNLHDLKRLIIEDIKDSMPVALLDALYVTDPSKAMPTSPEMAYAAHSDVQELIEQLKEVNSKVAAARAEISASEVLLKKGRDLLENERLLSPAEQDIWARFAKLCQIHDSDVVSDDEDDDRRDGNGLLDDEDSENLVDAVPPPAKPKVRYSTVVVRKNSEKDETVEDDEEEASASVSTGGDAARVICSGMAVGDSFLPKRHAGVERSPSNKRAKKL